MLDIENWTFSKNRAIGAEVSKTHAPDPLMPSPIQDRAGEWSTSNSDDDVKTAGRCWLELHIRLGGASRINTSESYLYQQYTCK